MLQEQLFEQVMILSRVELGIYLVLAMMFGWALRSLLRRTWTHRYWEPQAYQRSNRYPQASHSYVEYIPELDPRNSQRVHKNL